jgi:hypothetical protein
MSEPANPGQTCEATGPAVRPRGHGEPGRSPARLVRDMEVGEGWWLPRVALYIDRDWSVWIDPDSPLPPSHAAYHRDRPVLVMRTPAGWRVRLRDPRGLAGTFEVSEGNGVPEGFLPAECVE